MANAFEAGFLRDTATDIIAVTTSTTGAAWESGFLRSPTGELVVTLDDTGATWQTGFLRDDNGALVVQEGYGDFESGYPRTFTGALAIITQSSPGAALEDGFVRDGGGGILVSGLTTSKLAWTGDGATTTVTTLAELTTALAGASAGDTIELADGNYDFTAALSVPAGVRVKAQNQFGAVCRGATTAPASANAETTPAHIIHGLQVHGVDGVWIEDIYFKWFGVGVDVDSANDVVVQGCRFESHFDAGLSVFDAGHPRVHMNEFLDPYLAGDTAGTLTAAGSVIDAQSDYGVAIYGALNPRLTHNYFFGVFNQAASFKEGNVNAYAGYNTFEGTLYSALTFGQNGPSNGPFDHVGLPTGPDGGTMVAEYNVFRPIKDSLGNMYRMQTALRVWHVDGDVILRGNVVEAAVGGISVEGTDSGDAGYAAGSTHLEGNTVGGAWKDASGALIDVANVGIRFYKGISSACSMLNNVVVNHFDAAIDLCGDGGTQTGPCPLVNEVDTTTIAPTVGTLDLKTNSVALDPDLSFATSIL